MYSNEKSLSDPHRIPDKKLCPEGSYVNYRLPTGIAGNVLYV